MGWSGGSYIFDAVAQAVVEHKSAQEVLTALINELLDRDWDEWAESMGEFRDNEVVWVAFMESKVGDQALEIFLEEDDE